MAIPKRSAASWLALASSLLVPAAALAESAVPAPKPSTTYWVYVGTYTGDKSDSKGIYRFDLDAATGQLSHKALAAESASPSYLAVAPSGRFLYSVNEVPNQKSGAISAFALNPLTGDLKFLNQESSVGSGPCHLIVDKEGKHVLAANYGSGSTVVLPIDETGRVGDHTDFVQHVGKSADPKRQEGPHAHCCALDEANRFAFVCDLGLDKVLIYKYDAEKGKITPNTPPAADLAPGSGPRHIAFTPDCKYAYVVNELGSSITGFRYDADHGSLKEIETLSTLPKGADATGNSCAEVVVHPSGKFVFATNRGHDSVATFAIDPATGKMTYVGEQHEGIKVPRGFNVDPTGTWAVTANQDGDSIVVFAIDPKTGELKPTGVKAEVGKPVDVRIIPKPEQANLLRAAMSPVVPEQANRELGPSVKDFRRLGDFPYPVCLFFFTMRDDKGYYTWLLEPVVGARGKPGLAPRSEADCKPLNAESLDHIVGRVNAWYDALYAELKV